MPPVCSVGDDPGPLVDVEKSIWPLTGAAGVPPVVFVQFNPWMFSGTEALIASFFEEIGKQLERRESSLKGIAGKLATYGHLLSPFASLVGAGTAVSAATDVLSKLSAGPSVLEQRQEHVARGHELHDDGEIEEGEVAFFDGSAEEAAAERGRVYLFWGMPAGVEAEGGDRRERGLCNHRGCNGAGLEARSSNSETSLAW